VTSSSPQQQQQHSSSLFVGIDVAKETLDLAINGSATVRSFANDADGHQGIVELLRTQTVVRIVVESTGGLERPLIDTLLEADLPVALVNPANVRHFAKAHGILAKTDRLDARVLARFAEEVESRFLEKRSENQTKIHALVTCRQQHKQNRTRLLNQRGNTREPVAIASFDKLIETLDQEIKSLDEQIRKLIDSDDDFQEIDRLLRTVPGIGPVASATLVAEMPELGKTDRRQASALLGVAPYNNQSGNHDGSRSIRGGRASTRSTLYMAALTAMRINPVIKSFAERLKAQKKKNKVVIVAAMRKLITILNAMLRDGLEWSQLKLVQNANNRP
jgi:transposase